MDSKLPTLHETGLKNRTDKARYHRYLDFYESKFGHLRDQYFRLLEIGFWRGQSAGMWLDYFTKADIYFIDIKRIKYERDRFYFKRISQIDPRLSTMWRRKYFSVIIDDGSHMNSHQQKSMQLLWSRLKPGGFYVIEDLYTSFDDRYMDSELPTYNWLLTDPWAKSLGKLEIYEKIPGMPWDSTTAVITKA